MVTYSIVAPAYNEEEALHSFYQEVTAVMQTQEGNYELIFINDGSTDKTQSVINALAEQDTHVKFCRFSRNFGQQAAIYCGLKEASGEAVIVMDTDLQDPPSVLPEMIKLWKEGYQIIHGKRRTREQDKPFKRITAKAFYATMGKITDLKMQNSGDFKLYDRAVVNALLSMPEHDRLLRVQACWVGFRQTSVEFDRPQRIAGTSHYTVKKMAKLAQTGILPNTDAPLTLPLKLGAGLAVVSVLAMAVLLVLTLSGALYDTLTPWLFPVIGLATGVILFCQGLSNLYTYMIYKEVQNRPQYILAEKGNFDEETKPQN